MPETRFLITRIANGHVQELTWAIPVGREVDGVKLVKSGSSRKHWADVEWDTRLRDVTERLSRDELNEHYRKSAERLANLKAQRVSVPCLVMRRAPPLRPTARRKSSSAHRERPGRAGMAHRPTCQQHHPIW